MMTNNNIPAITGIISSIGAGISTYFAVKTKEKLNLLRFASLTSLVFALQMLNFPIQNGTSGHFLGITLLILLLGIPYGILAMTIILTIQCLVFADGGISVLGANILNMALVGALPALFYSYFIKENEKLNIVQRNIFIFFVSWFSIFLAAFSCSIELWLSNTITFEKVMPAMLKVHSIIGIFEGVITIALFSILYKDNKTIEIKNNFRFILLPFIMAIVIVLILTPFASSLPDGLEWVAEKYNFLHENAPYFVSPFADYKIFVIKNEIISTGLAGLIGVTITFLAILFIGVFINFSNKLK